MFLIILNFINAVVIFLFFENFNNVFYIGKNYSSTKIIDNYNEIKKKLEAKNDDILVERFKKLNLNNPNDKNNSKYDKIAIDYKEKQIEISKED